MGLFILFVMEISDKQFLFKALQLEQKRKRKCMYPWCKYNAINSHVFQQKGILFDMSVKWHLIVLEPPDIWKINFEANEVPDISLHIKRRWVKEAYSFPGFCNIHDTQIFTPIETDITKIDFSEYRSQLLFSYRWLCNELHRKIVVNAYFENVFNKLLDEENYDGAEYLSYSKDWTKAWIVSLEQFKETMENVLFYGKDESQFTFQTFIFPRFDVWISTALSVLNASQTAADWVRDFKEWLQTPNQFINIFPIGDSSVVIIGEQSDLHSDFFEYLVDKFWKCSSLEEYKGILSDLITARLEFWCMSPDLFFTLNKEKLNQYIEFFTANINSHNFDLHSWINIFEQ